jgi:ABC-type dipeptide/oligopeptide/nickel transport system ATPase component
MRSTNELSADPVLEIRGLSVRYDTVGGRHVTALEGVDLLVRKGEIHGLVGGSGSGKSTLINSVLGLAPSSAEVEGEIVLDDQTDLVGLDERHFRRLRGSQIGYVGQDGPSSLHPLKTVWEHFRALYRAHRVGGSRTEQRGRARAALDRVGIVDPEATLTQFPHQLSGGMAQRVVIALATSLSPRLLLADEPTSALDLTVQRRVLELLAGLRDGGTSMLLITHDLGVVAHYCDSVTVLHHGRVVEAGPVSEVFVHPVHEYTRGLLTGAAGSARRDSHV